MLLYYSFLLTSSIPLCAFLTFVTNGQLDSGMLAVFVNKTSLNVQVFMCAYVSPFNKLVGKLLQLYLGFMGT